MTPIDTGPDRALRHAPSARRRGDLRQGPRAGGPVVIVGGGRCGRFVASELAEMDGLAYVDLDAICGAHGRSGDDADIARALAAGLSAGGTVAWCSDLGPSLRAALRRASPTARFMDLRTGPGERLHAAEREAAHDETDGVPRAGQEMIAR